jgi:NADH-quinone oxidoreductase subunit M
MCAALFAMNDLSVQGAMIQLFSHGINIIGMWVVVDIIERQTGVKNISQLGGIAHKAPVLTIFLVIIALANIALPLTNAFVGEFLMFSGLWQARAWYALAAGISIILAAVYKLRLIQKLFYGEVTQVAEAVTDISLSEKATLTVIVVLIFVLGVMPQPVIELTKEAVKTLLAAGK